MKRNLFLMAMAFVMTAIVGCSSEDDANNPSPTPDPSQAITKVNIIDPIGYAQNMGAWIPATTTDYKKLLLEEGQHYLLGVICEPTSIKNPVVDWNVFNSQFEEAAINAQGIVTGVMEDKDNTNQCLVTATSDSKVADTIEVCVLKEISGVYEIKNADPDIVFIDGGSKRSTSYVTSASNASGALQNKDLITAFFSDKNRANFNDAVTISFVSGSSFDIQGNGTGVNILMAYSKAYLPTSVGTVYFDNVRDYTVMTCTSRRQANMVDSSYVSLNNHNLHLATGENFQLTGTLTAMNKIKKTPVCYASSNPAVATVDATGKVTAVGKGLATVTSYTNHLAESQYCVVNVDNTIPVAVTRTVDVVDFTTAHTVSRCLIVKGKTKLLYPDSHKDELIAATGTDWSSSDPSVATVVPVDPADDKKGAVVTAVAPGNAIIYNTPYTEDVNGNRSYGIADCSCFTVMPDYSDAQVGDIFYSDGSSNTDLVSGKTPIGIIVYKTPAAGPTELTESGEIGQYAAEGAATNYHGLVMALNNAATGVKWGKDNTQSGLTGVTVTNDDATMKGTAGASGNMSAYGAAVSTNAQDVVTGTPTFEPDKSYPASCAAWNYDVTVPTYCTGWFMPTAPQWYNVLVNGLGGVDATTVSWNDYFDATNSAFTKINTALAKVSGSDALPTTGNGLIWTINEGDASGTTAAVLIKDASGLKFTTNAKNDESAQTIVRPFFAF